MHHFDSLHLYSDASTHLLKFAGDEHLFSHIPIFMPDFVTLDWVDVHILNNTRVLLVPTLFII